MIKKIRGYLKNLIERGQADAPQDLEQTPFINTWMVLEAPGNTIYKLNLSMEKIGGDFKSIDLYGTPLVFEIYRHPIKSIELGDLTPIKENVYYIVKNNERGIHFERNLTMI